MTVQMNFNMKDILEPIVKDGLEMIQQHPFIQKGNTNELTLEQATKWFMCAGRESKTFPIVLENMIEKTSSDEVLAILKENLDDEYGNGNPDHAHFKHYLHFLEKIGVTQHEFEKYEEKAGIKLALSLANSISKQDNIGISLGYMLINEGITEITYKAMKSTFLKYYPNVNTTFFDIHIEVDEHHVNELYKAAELIGNDYVKDITFGIKVGQRGMEVLLDEALGIYDIV